MIIIDNGVPKSATTLILAYQKDLIAASSAQNGMEQWSKFNHGSVFIPTIAVDQLDALVSIERDFGDFVIKMHRPPEDSTRKLVEDFKAKVTCCFRDPRDIVLSAMDHGARTRTGLDKSGAFANIFTVQDGAREFKEWSRIYYEWQKYGHALLIRYEDLLADKLTTLTHMVKFLGMNLGAITVTEICDKHERNKQSAWNYNKGVSHRWRVEMSSEDLAWCNDMLADDITRMGYSIE